MADAVRLAAFISDENRTGERGVDAPIPALTTTDNGDVDMADNNLLISASDDNDVVVKGRPATHTISIYPNLYGQIVILGRSDDGEEVFLLDPRDADAVIKALIAARRGAK
jgi:hypothetical protein